MDVLTSGGRARLGTFRTAPPASSRLGVRVVALCSVPGAIGWDFLVEPIAPYPAGVGGTLKVESCEEASELGIVVCDGSLLEAGPETGASGAGAYRHAAGVGVGAAVIPAGARVRGWSLAADAAAAATALITSPEFGPLPLITVPKGDTFGDTPENLIGPASIAFGGVPAAWWVSWRELG